MRSERFDCHSKQVLSVLLPMGYKRNLSFVLESGGQSPSRLGYGSLHRRVRNKRRRNMKSEIMYATRLGLGDAA
jgi:hypothetical protein